MNENTIVWFSASGRTIILVSKEIKLSGYSQKSVVTSVKSPGCLVTPSRAYATDYPGLSNAYAFTYLQLQYLFLYGPAAIVGKRGFEHTSKALRYGMRSQEIPQFYLHTPRSSANGMNRPWRDGRLSWPC